VKPRARRFRDQKKSRTLRPAIHHPKNHSDSATLPSVTRREGGHVAKRFHKTVGLKIY
jgi:hypothetical protein